MKLVLNIPAHMKIAYAVRLGYAVSKPGKYLRVGWGICPLSHYYQSKKIN